MKKYQKYIDIARPFALSVDRYFKHTSLVICKNTIVAVGTNHSKTHPLAVQKGYLFPERHSELDAYIRIPKQYKDKNLVLINFRFNRRGELRNSKPCRHCEPWVRNIFKEVVYSIDDGLSLLL